jgi:DNA-binding beta-propeller fold protein YncE
VKPVLSFRPGPGHPNGYSDLAVSPDGGRLYIAGAPHLAYSLEGSPLGAAGNSVGDRIVAAGEFVYAYGNSVSGPATVYDAQGAKLGVPESNDVLPVPSAELVASADGTRLLARGRKFVRGDRDDQGRIVTGDVWWLTDLAIGVVGPTAMRAVVLRTEGWIEDHAVSPDGRQALVAVITDGRLRLIGLEDGSSRSLNAWAGRTDLRLFWPEGGKPLVSLATNVGRPSELSELDVDADATTPVWGATDLFVRDVGAERRRLARTPDGKTLVAALATDLYVFDTTARRSKRVVTVGKDILAIALTKGGERLYALTHDEVMAFDVSALVAAKGLD